MFPPDGAETPASRIFRINSAGTAAWYLTDRQESIRGMTDNTGTLQETVHYDGYGNIVSDSNPTFGDRYKYTGRELDSVTDGPATCSH